MVALLAAQLATAWRRWQQRAALHLTAGATAAALSGNAQRSADDEAQYELVAMGLAAALSDAQLQQLFSTSTGGDNSVLSLLLPLQTKFAHDAQQFHFSLVVVAKLLAQLLESESDQIQFEPSSATRIVDELLLPLLRYQQHARVHGIALSMLKQLVRVCDSATTEKLASQVHAILVDDSSSSPADEPVISFSSLCAVLQLLLDDCKASQDQDPTSSTEALVAQTQRICLHAIACFDTSPVFLRAVAIQLVPALLRLAPALAQELTEVTVDAWRMVRHDRSKSVANLMYLLCLVLPSEPTLMHKSGLQEIVAFTLVNNDPLLRKQGMFLLNIAFSHYVVLQAEYKGDADAVNNNRAALETWQSFITASEVIQMHQQQHLIEQVWPQVTLLIESSLVVMLQGDDDSRDDAAVSPSSVSTAATWPVKFSFDWVQSLLIRVFCHENPIVRRMFMSTFMATCLSQWRALGEKARILGCQGKRVIAIDVSASFACSASFRSFTFEHLLRAFNDPQMYKTSTKEAFQQTISDFLAAYLGFQLKWSGSNSSKALPEEPGLMRSYVDAVHEAVFGLDATGHSPEALLSMLEVFCSPELQSTVSSASKVSPGDLLDEAAVERLRMIMEFRVMRSFPQSIRVKITRTLVDALTGGFTDAAAHSLHSLAGILLVLPLNNVIGLDGSTYQRIHVWLRSQQQQHEDGSTKTDGFIKATGTVLSQYLRKSEQPQALGTAHLARLLLFTADMNESSADDEEPVQVELCTPLVQFVSHHQSDDRDNVDSLKLLHLIGKFEDEVEQVVQLTSHASVRTRFAFSFSPRDFYGPSTSAKDASDQAPGLFGCQSLFEIGLGTSKRWINSRFINDDDDEATTTAKASQELVEQALDEASEKEDKVDLLTATAVAVTQMATYAMEQHGDLQAMDALNGLCESLLSILSNEKASHVTASEQTLAMRFLAIISSRTKALDSLHALQGHSTLPLLLKAQLNASTDNGSRHYARCTVQFFVSKWTLLHNVLLASSYIPTDLLHQVFRACLDALPAAGSDPLVLYEMVQVLSLALTQLAATFVNAEDRDERLDELYHAVWGEYSECQAKPDILTRAVVYCLFQPAFLLSKELSGGKDAIMKRWFHRFLSFGQVHRPNVVFHLTCRVSQVWRAMPHAALWFVDEIVTLLLYKEPVIDEKEQLTVASDPPSPGSNGLQAKNKFVRLVVLSLLDEMSVDVATPSSSVPSASQLLQELILRLLELNLTDEWTKQHMVNSDGFGRKLRCWQALCVLSRHVSFALADQVNNLVWRAFVFPHLPAMRYYMELFAMRLLLAFPRVTIERYMVPLLQNYNLMPQVGASLLLVAGYAVHSLCLDGTSQLAGDKELSGMLVEAIVPWLNASHGHTRILVQFLLAVVLPPYLHQHQVQQETGDLAFLQQTAAFLSQNKECKRMHRRQLMQLSKFQPAFECSLLGVLSSAAVNDFLELFPTTGDVLRFSAQFKHAMHELHAQFQRENFCEDTPGKAAIAKANNVTNATTGPLTTTGLNVQRKIDTSASVLLDESVLPAAMQTTSGGRETVDSNNVNARNRRRQPVILCASLVDKTPNLAGLARTCEIFNAQSLVVPNLHVCEDDMFSTISVTANKWMPMAQVRPSELVQQLTLWKREGFTIVALEQTASSVCLSSYAFPEKLVIVLGREKEGVPVDVLQLVDVCVEIPQFGLIRSLNVHVSGAILLWEYTQQRMLRQ